MKILVLALLLASDLSAADAGRRYLKMKDDADLFVGEGVAELKEFKDDGLKALQAAKERAAGGLAAAIRVRVKAEVKEVSDSAGGQTITSKSESLAEVVLEGLRYEDFVDFPEKGRITVLAWVTKEQYRRSLAGKSVPLYRTQYGLRLRSGIFEVGSLQAMRESGQNLPDALKTQPSLVPESGSSLTAPHFGLDFTWRSWVLGADFQMDELFLYIHDPSPGAGVQMIGSTSYYSKRSNRDVFSISTGYEWAPWAWRVQPVLPLRVSWTRSSFADWSAQAFGLETGLKLRYWPNDALYFEAGGRWLQGLNTSAFTDDRNGKWLMVRSDRRAELNMTGYGFQAGITWTGF